MKKLLALVLALVMTLSLCVTSNAAFAGEEYDYDEAVEVMAAVGVFQGDENGKFNGKAELTREQAAKLIAYLDLGKKVAEALPAVKAFNDVEATRWSAKYIAYCADAGYLAGVGNGNFDPAGKLTGYAFGKMLLCALGYKAENEGFTGTNWTIKVAALMESNKIAKGIDGSAAATLTREETAQYCFNTLKADCVKYDNSTAIKVGDVEIKQSTKAETYTTGNVGYGDGNVQLLEKLYKGDLTYTGNDSDDFGRTAHSWKYKRDTVTTVADTAKVVFTKKTKAANVAKELSGIFFNNAAGTDTVKISDTALTTFNPASTNLVDVQAVAGKQAEAAITGVTNTAGYISGLTANGKAVEVYTNDDNVITKIVAVKYTVAEVTKVATNAKGDETSYTIGNTTYKTFTDEEKDDEIVFETAPVKGDIVTVAKINPKLVYVYATTSFTGAQSAKNASNDEITVDGTKYTVATGVYDGTNDVAMADFDNSSKSNNTYYVDQYGCVVKTTAAAASKDYAYIVDAYVKHNSDINGTTPAVTVRAVLADGSVAVYTVETEKIKSSSALVGQAAANDVVTIAAGDYVVKGTKIVVLDADNTALAVTNAQNALKRVFGYTLSDNVLTLEDKFETLADGSTTLLAGVGSGGNANYVVKNDTQVAVTGGKTALLQKDTTIVVYDDDNESAKVYTGAAGLNSTALVNFEVVVSGSNGTVGTAKIIFATVTGGVAKEVSNYVYVDKDDVTVILDGTKTKYVYTGLMPDGSELTLTSSDALSNDGLYKYAEDNTTKAANEITLTGRFLTGTAAVSGSLVSVNGGTTYYNMDNAQVVYVDDDLYEVNGNNVILVLGWKDGSATTDVETIYVY